MDTTEKTYLAISIAALVAMLVIFRLVAKRTPRGTLLALGICLWIVGQSLAPGTTRPMRLTCGLLMASGFVGGLMGLLDAARPRKPVASNTSPPGD